MPDHFINNTQHWQDRAIRMRDAAAGVEDVTARDTMLRIAVEYEHLAKRAAERVEAIAEKARIEKTPRV